MALRPGWLDERQRGPTSGTGALEQDRACGADVFARSNARPTRARMLATGMEHGMEASYVRPGKIMPVSEPWARSFPAASVNLPSDVARRLPECTIFPSHRTFPVCSTPGLTKPTFSW